MRGLRGRLFRGAAVCCSAVGGHNEVVALAHGVWQRYAAHLGSLYLAGPSPATRSICQRGTGIASLSALQISHAAVVPPAFVPASTRILIPVPVCKSRANSMLLQEKLDTMRGTLQGRSRAGHGVESMSRRHRRVPTVTAAAIAQEQHDELLAAAAQRHAVADPVTGEIIRDPRVERAEWRDPTDLDPHRRHARLICGFRRVDVLRNLHARGGLVTPQHLVAAERLTADYEISIAGASLRDPSQPAIRSTAGGPGDAQLAAATRYREAVEAVGPAAYAVLTPVVLDNWTVRELAARRGVGQQVALGLLVAALDRLVEWYDSLAAPRHQRAA